MSTPDAQSESYLRRGTEETLRRAFQRCHNFIHGNEGMPKDAAFWQFLYLIFAKMYDERRNGGHRQFWADATEPFTEEGRMKVKQRIMPLFRGRRGRNTARCSGRPDTITLSERIEQESYVLNGKTLTRPRKVRSLEIDDDFPAIIDAYWEFRRRTANRGWHDHPH